MQAITAGIVAHVDAGKTTLSEALLYRAGTLRQLGRVDKGDSFLDPDDLEKQRGITIFSHQAQLTYQDVNLTLLDTPGHVDFASQTEQVLSVLDYAILVVSATDGIQGYTRTLWRLLAHYQVPTFIFVNKMDVKGTDQTAILAQLQTELSAGCVPFGESLSEATTETMAMQDETVLTQYLETGVLSDQTIQQLIQQRLVFPCFFGAALKVDGVDDLLAGLAHWTQPTPAKSEFGARVFKISYDESGTRLTWLRLTGGSLQTKAHLLDDQQINQIRVYNGAKFQLVPTLTAGAVGAIPNLTNTHPGQGLGIEQDAATPVIQPVLNYTVDPKGQDLHHCLTILEQLADEDPQLHVVWSAELQEIRLQIMGRVQLEILQQRLQEQFHLDIGFGEGSILYKETITQAVEGVGHFEPLRHYAEVHLLLQPTAPGSGLTLAADCPLEVLGRNWQHQVLSNLRAKTQLGVLTGSPLTDVKITLVTGRASNVHSVGGDFREATWRALRQGLMMLTTQGACQLLEPWYRFRLEVGQAQVGRAMTDIQRMHGNFEGPEPANNGTDLTVLTGSAPVAEMQDYSQTVNAYTHGQGQLECVIDGYQPCHNAVEVVATQAYQPVADLENTPDSVFCAHGAGYPVPWDQVPAMAHVPYVYTAAALKKLSH